MATMGKAAEILKKRGLAIAAKKAEREAKEGLIESYVHAGSRVASLIEVNCETDFVARTEIFKELVHDLAMQVVAGRPLYVRPEDVPADVVGRGKAQGYRARESLASRSSVLAADRRGQAGKVLRRELA